jgi:hypothetical protein
MDLIIAIIYFLIVVAVLVGVVYLVTWVLGQLGISIPPPIMNVIWVIVFLVVLLWLIQAVAGAGWGLPSFR